MRDEDPPSGFTDEQKLRYARHLVLPHFGAGGQRKLLDSSALVVGAGGLGSPVIQYLAAAGVGRLGIADPDVVELPDLQRQTIHAGRLGTAKAKSAARFVRDLNPEVEVKAYGTGISVKNVQDLVRDYDVVLDCTDNFPAKFLLNDACVLDRKPLCHGSIFRFEGQVTTILPHRQPCYRCYYHRAPPPGESPSCEEVGVLGVVAGVIGCIQAVEAVKLLSGVGTLLSGRILYFDGFSSQFTFFPPVDGPPMQRDPDCPVCGGHPSITEIDASNY